MIQRAMRKRKRGYVRALALEVLEPRTLFSFGVSTGTIPSPSNTTLVVDNGGNLKFSIVTGGTITSTLHLGDVASIQYKGKEMLAPYSATSRYSHYEQGLGSLTKITYTVDNTNGWILVTEDDSAETSGGVIQYFAVRKGDDNIYMASLPTDVNNGPGEGRFLAYLNKSVFTNVENPSDISQNVGAVEGSDVFYNADGTTHSKFYNMNRRMIDNIYHGVTGSATGTTVGAWMFMGNREHSAGGPFMKDIDFQTTSAAVEMYNCLFTGHTQTEAYRQGLEGPYALQFTSGGAPAAVDYSWMDGLVNGSGQSLISGYVGASGRGTVSGTATGVPAGFQVTVGLASATAQYWGYAGIGGNYSISGVLPGTYTETLYQGELAVATKTVTVAAQQTTASSIVDAMVQPSTIWSIGAWDGTPAGFLNADQIAVMHPSDVRMSPWPSMTTYTIGSSGTTAWPLLQAKDENNDSKVVFNLSAAQIKTALTLRIGISFAFAGGRPYIVVNQGKGNAWTSAIPSPSTQPDSRGITRGTWRGNNVTFTYTIPTSALIAGQNTIDIIVASGSTTTGWLSPSVTYDAIDLLGANVAPTVAAGASATPQTVEGKTTNLKVLGADDDGESELSYAWTVAGPGAVAFSDNNSNSAKNATATFAGPGTYQFTCTITDAGGLSTTSSTTVVVDGTAPAVVSSVVNDGSSQRSMVNSVTVSFSRAVTLGAGAITVGLHGSVNGGGPVGTAPDGVNWTTSDGGLTYVVTFSGTGVTAGSIADGVYDLTVHGSQVTDVWGHTAADSTMTFYRLFGDVNGDGSVDSLDTLFFRARQGSAAGSSGYVWYLDYDNSGTLDSLDSLQLRKRLGTIYTIS